MPFENEQRVLGKDGKYRWYLNRYNPFLDEQGKLVRWYATGTDIDDRKRPEDRVRNENIALREDIVRSSMFEEIVGSSSTLRRVLANVERVAPSDSTVLILGETGTGKELIARAIHRGSSRSGRAFVRVNCAAIPAALIGSELFGHERGAFTGALQRRMGRFESADGGTIFLDEIGDLPAETQIALLRVPQEREFERVGSNHSISVNVRVVAATNRDLDAVLLAGTFRQDLFTDRMFFQSMCLRFAKGSTISHSCSNTSSNGTRRRPESRSAASRNRRYDCFRHTIGQATSANCRT
jgi:formate hydrogenlyase transcriptional activator